MPCRLYLMPGVKLGDVMSRYTGGVLVVGRDRWLTENITGAIQAARASRDEQRRRVRRFAERLKR